MMAAATKLTENDIQDARGVYEKAKDVLERMLDQADGTELEKTDTYREAERELFGERS